MWKKLMVSLTAPDNTTYASVYPFPSDPTAMPTTDTRAFRGGAKGIFYFRSPQS